MLPNRTQIPKCVSTVRVNNIVELEGDLKEVTHMSYFACPIPQYKCYRYYWPFSKCKRMEPPVPHVLFWVSELYILTLLSYEPGNPNRSSKWRRDPMQKSEVNTYFGVESIELSGVYSLTSNEVRCHFMTPYIYKNEMIESFTRTRLVHNSYIPKTTNNEPPSVKNEDSSSCVKWK